MKPSKIEAYATRRYHFDASHVLKHHTGKCSNLHGHTYIVEVTTRMILGEHGISVDFLDISTTVKPLIDYLDHSNLNERTGYNDPTAELLAVWMITRIRQKFPGFPLYSIKIQEGLDSWVTLYAGDVGIAEVDIL